MSARFDHPELVVVGKGIEAMAGYINSVGDRIARGETFSAGDVLVGSRGQHHHLVAVHAAHFTNGTFAVSEEYYEALGESMPPAHAIEIVWPGRAPRLVGRRGFYE